MVNVQDPHPFLLRPPPHRSSLTPSRSLSRTSSPGGSHSLTPDGEHHSERSSSLANGFPPREPILDVKLIRTQKRKSRKVSGGGRGRDRTRARDGAPLIGNGKPFLSRSPIRSALLNLFWQGLSMRQRRKKCLNYHRSAERTMIW